jgi:hypothetical protein
MYYLCIMLVKLMFCCGFSVLPALSLTEHCDIVECTFDTASFYSFVEHTLDQMQQYPPNSVLVMDNCHIHKHPSIQELIESQFVYFL